MTLTSSSSPAEAKAAAAQKGRKTTIIIFRGKTVKRPYSANRDKQIQAGDRYHATYRINYAASCTRALCGILTYIDFTTPFEIIGLDEMNQSIFFIEEQKRKRNELISHNITPLFCKRCLTVLLEDVLVTTTTDLKEVDKLI